MRPRLIGPLGEEERASRAAFDSNRPQPVKGHNHAGVGTMPHTGTYLSKVADPNLPNPANIRYVPFRTTTNPERYANPNTATQNPRYLTGQGGIVRGVDTPDHHPETRRHVQRPIPRPPVRPGNRQGGLDLPAGRRGPPAHLPGTRLHPHPEGGCDGQADQAPHHDAHGPDRQERRRRHPSEAEGCHANLHLPTEPRQGWHGLQRGGAPRQVGD
jgi:hypothetical protein